MFIHLLATIARLMRLGGARAVVAESLLVKHQLVILNRGRERAPNLRPMDRVIAGFCTLFIRPDRLGRCGVALKTSTLRAFHAESVKRKYRRLFSPKRRGKPGPKGPSPELIAACTPSAPNAYFYSCLFFIGASTLWKVILSGRFGKCPLWVVSGPLGLY